MEKRTRKDKTRKTVKKVRDAFAGAALLGIGAVAGCGGDTHYHYYSPDAGTKKPDATLVDSGDKSDATDCSLSYSTKCEKKENRVRCILLPGKSVELDGLVFRYNPKEDGSAVDWFDVVDQELGCRVAGKVEFQDISLGGSEKDKLVGTVTVYGRTYIVTLHRPFELQEPSATGHGSYAFDVEITRINGEHTCEHGIVGPVVEGKLEFGHTMTLDDSLNGLLGLRTVEIADVSRLGDGTKEVSVQFSDDKGFVLLSPVLENDSMTVVQVGGHKLVIEVKDAFIGDTFNEKSAVIAIYGCV